MPFWDRDERWSSLDGSFRVGTQALYGFVGCMTTATAMTWGVAFMPVVNGDAVANGDAAASGDLAVNGDVAGHGRAPCACSWRAGWPRTTPVGGHDPGGGHGCPSGTVMSAGPLWTRVFPCGHSGPLRVCRVYDNRDGNEMGSRIHARGERQSGGERRRGVKR